MGEGKNPGTSHLLKLAAIATIKQPKALEIIDQVKYAVSRWNDFAKLADVSPKSTKNIKIVLDEILKIS